MGNKTVKKSNDKELRAFAKRHNLSLALAKRVKAEIDAEMGRAPVARAKQAPSAKATGGFIAQVRAYLAKQPKRVQKATALHPRVAAFLTGVVRAKNEAIGKQRWSLVGTRGAYVVLARAKQNGGKRYVPFALTHAGKLAPSKLHRLNAHGALVAKGSDGFEQERAPVKARVKPKARTQAFEEFDDIEAEDEDEELLFA